MSKKWRFFLILFIATLVITASLQIFYTYPRISLPSEPEELKTAYGTFLFAGDVMIHDSQIESAYHSNKDIYCFRSCFEMLKPILEKTDLAVVNLETTLAGRDKIYTGYPSFNSPESLALALKEAGFNLVSTANNHSLDRGSYGVKKTLFHLKEAGLEPFGTYQSWVKREKPLIVDVNGIKAAFFSYTNSTNGIPIPEGEEYLVNMLEPETIIADMHQVRHQADVIILYLHWGIEYHREPSKSQYELARTLFQEGASIIIGNHPHVVQRVEYIQFQEGEEVYGKTVAYSLGNLTGDQVIPYTDTGIMLAVKVKKEPLAEKGEILEVTYVPTWIHRFYQNGRKNFRVLPLLPCQDYLTKLGEDPLIHGDTLNHIQEIQKELKEHIGNIPQGLPSSRKDKKLETIID